MFSFFLPFKFIIIRFVLVLVEASRRVRSCFENFLIYLLRVKMRFRHFIKSEEKENDAAGKVLESEDNLIHQVNDASDVLTLEGLRRTYNSCSNCGVCWYDDHISLDCSECGGYSMTRPCPTCNGQCGSKWRRDVKASRVKKQAQWHGLCSWKANTLAEDSNANYQTINCLPTSMVHQTM